MLKQNSVTTGLAAGLLFPALAWFAACLFRYNTYLINKPGLPFFLAIACNLLTIRYFFKKDAELTCRGLMLVTFAFMLAIFIFKIQLIR